MSASPYTIGIEAALGSGLPSPPSGAASSLQQQSTTFAILLSQVSWSPHENETVVWRQQQGQRGRAQPEVWPRLPSAPVWSRLPSTLV
jgi:hypothetical protein